MKEKHYLIIYDISDEKRLRKVAKLLEQYAIRVQKSVFEGTMSESIKNRVRREIEGIINCDEDYVVIFSICEKDWQKREKYGVQEYLDDEIESRDYYLFDL